MKKKITIICCIMIIIFNFIFSSVNVVKADDEKSQTTQGTEQLTLDLGEDVNKGAKDFISNMKNGVGYMAIGGATGNTKSINLKDRLNVETEGTIMSMLVRVLTFAVAWANNIPQLAVEATDGNLDLEYFTVYSLVMGEYDFFNLNFFVKEEETQNASLVDAISGAVAGDGNVFEDIADVLSGKAKTPTLSAQIKSNIRTFYYLLRNLSIGISLFVLIYIAIRMAISTVQSDKARYKKMFVDWLASFVLLMFMHFIIIGISFLSTEALGLIRKLAQALGVTNIEYEIFDGKGELVSYLVNPFTISYHLINSLITIAIFVYYQLKFFITYVRRFCEIAFLIVVSPLVTITYSIDKVADNKAQAFNSWFQEISVKYAIQIVHALTYCIFIASAGAIAKEVPLLGALFLLCLDKAEKIFRNVLRVNYDGFQRAKVPFFGRKGKKK